jgi:hypothetical protein
MEDYLQTGDIGLRNLDEKEANMMPLIQQELQVVDRGSRLRLVVALSEP